MAKYKLPDLTEKKLKNEILFIRVPAGLLDRIDKLGGGKRQRSALVRDMIAHCLREIGEAEEKANG